MARGEASRQAILAAVVRLIAVGGLPAVTHRAVAAEAGVSPALPTYHFAVLDDLLSATAAWVTEVAAARLQVEIDRVQSGAVSLLDATTAFLAFELGPNRAMFIAKLELDIAAAQRVHWSNTGIPTSSRFVDLIRIFVPDHQAAEAIFAAVFGFTVLNVVQGLEVDEQVCRRFLRDLFHQYQLAEPDKARPQFLKAVT